MEQKTKVHAEDGKQELTITRDFDLPVELLFKAHTDADIFEQWMTHEYGTVKVLKLEAKKHGSWQFNTSDPKGNVVFSASGVYADFVPNQRITRTFEMENSQMPIYLEFIEFEKLADDTSRLIMHIVYKSVEQRDQLLQYGFAQGVEGSHDRLQNVVGKLRISA